MRMLLLKTWRDMLAHKGQFLALILLVALGVTVYVGFVDAYLNLKTSADTVYQQLAFEDFSVEILGAPLSAVARVRAIPGVLAAEGRLVGDVGMDLPGGGQGTARIVSTPAARTPAVNRLVIEKGRGLARDDGEAALLHVQFAQETGMHSGDRIVVRTGATTHAIPVVGIAASPEYMFPVRAKGELPELRSFTILWMPERAAGTLLGRTGQVTDVAVRITPSADLKTVMKAVEQELKPYGVVANVARADQPSNSSLQSEIEENGILAGIMPPLILAIAVLSLSIALSRLVQSQRGEIGLAKALGYGDADILFHYLLFSAGVAVGGSLVGVLAGHALGAWMTGLYVDMLGVPMLRTAWNPGVILTAIGLSTACCLLAGLAPALRSARMAPARAMHADPNASLTGGHTPLGERLVSPLLPRSLVWRIPFRNVFRSRRRSAYTIIGIALAVLLSVGTIAFFDSINYLLNVHFSKVERWDVSAFFERPFGASLVDEATHWDGVRRVQTVVVVPATLETAIGKHDGPITGVAANSSFHSFEIVSGSRVADTVRAGSLILPDVIARKLGVRVGDAVRVKTPYREGWTTVPVGSISREALGTPIFTGTGRALELTGMSSGARNGMYLDVADSKAAGVKRKLFDLPGVTQVLILTQTEQMVRDMMEFTYVMFALLLAFGFAMAFAVIYNTFTANVLERTREIATMRTIGEDSGHLTVMITIENLLLALVGIPLGIWAGLRFAQWVLSAMSSEEYSMRIVIEPISVASVVAGILVVLLLSEIPPVRRIFRLDLAEATKVME
jgi:putative ABC transport system permease protein